MAQCGRRMALAGRLARASIASDKMAHLDDEQGIGQGVDTWSRVWVDDSYLTSSTDDGD